MTQYEVYNPTKKGLKARNRLAEEYNILFNNQ